MYDTYLRTYLLICRLRTRTVLRNASLKPTVIPTASLSKHKPQPEIGMVWS